MYRGDIRLSDTIDLKFTTRSFSTGAPTTLAGTPVISAYVGNSTTQITAGITLTVDFDAVTGLHNVRVAATGANGYATASNYDLVITTGTVGGVSVVGEVVGSFSIENRSAVMPTTAARTLDVSAGGEAGVDWANVGTPGSTVSLSATTVATVTTTTTATNVTTVNGLAANVITAASMNADASAEIADAVWDEDATGHQTTGTFGQAIGDPVADTNTIYKAVVSDATGATVGVDVVALKAETVLILSDTNAILVDTGTTLDGRLPAALVSGRIDASVGAMAAGVVTAAAIATGAIDADALATDAVTEIRSIVSGTADSGTTTTMVDAARTEADTDYWKDMAILFTSGTISGQARLITAFNAATDTFTFSPATTQAVGTNTYEIITNVAAAGASAPTAAEVADAVWDEDATAHQTGGTFGQAIGDPAADTNTIFGAVVTGAAGATIAADIVAVQADTDDIQARLPAALVGGRMDSDIEAINNDATAADNIAKTTRAIGRGTCAAGATTTSIPTSSFVPNGAAADQFKGRIITFDADTTTTALRGQATDITASSNAAAPTFTVTALTTAPASGDLFSVT